MNATGPDAEANPALVVYHSVPTPPSEARVKPDQATTLAIRALAFLASDDDALGRFLGTTGMDPAELRAGADDPVVLAGVLDFLLSEEPLLLQFCAEARLRPEEPQRARVQLPGFMPRD